MKKFLLSALLCAAFFTQISAQTYQPFPTQNAVWQGSVSDFLFSEFVQHFIEGDTVINGKSYHKVLRESTIAHEGIPPGSGNPTTYEHVKNFVCAYREENKRIYFVRPFLTAENVGYDFNLQVGDTLPRNQLLGTEVRIVTAIDSIENYNGGGVWKKRFTTYYSPSSTSLNYPVHYIEGVGADKYTAGVLPPRNSPPSDPEFKQICFRQANFSWFFVDITGNPNPPTCQLVLNSTDPRPEILSISPNPMSDVSSIRVENWEQLLGGRLEVSDVAGRLLFQKTIQSESDFRLQRSDFQAGMLLVSVKSRQGVLRYVGKLIAE